MTRIAVREARLKEIKQEIMNCDKLKSFFEDNPRDIQSLRQDKALHTVRLQSHLKDVPDYMVPESLKRLSGLRKRKHKFNREAAANGATATKSRRQARASNPLVNFNIMNKSKHKK